MRHGMSRWGLGVLLAVSVLLAGCGGSSGRPRAVAVSGVLTLDGQPVKGARIRFVPVAEGGRTAIGDTDDTGKFTLATFEPGDGIVPGEYDADVATNMAAPTTPAPSTGDIAAKVAAERPPEGGVPSKYTDAKTSGLHYTFTEDDGGRVVEVKLTK
ncbi:MAG: hypothetical protein JNG89_06715 [Planctomycetaceae bacterium]|nr:hypothetical protein [Planctomycetaceae bacterium]